MFKVIAGAVGVILALASVAAQEKDYQPTCTMCPGTYIPSAEIDAYVKRAIANQLTDQQVRFFETRVRPVLAEHCYKCHGEKTRRSDLRLDSAAAMREGGASGEPLLDGTP